MANEKTCNPFEEIHNQLNRIEDLLSNINQRLIQIESSPSTGDAFMDVNEASNFLGDAKATLYGRTSKNEIPFYKRGKKVYFKRSDLIKWIEEGRVKTSEEIRKELKKRY
ncbi:MAG: helix-turn-helix domain-containing protein [Cyclobacteriaceae bacterium]|nr:helix-turn-helix domain-containing protein [Cyclobacteriaceae bacterium HetDA_MAG_MS6]